MVLEGYYGASNDDQAVETVRRALDVGMTMIDSADAYGNGHNETLVGRAIKNRRREAEATLLPTLRDLGIALVAWSPLGSGFLTGTVSGLDKNDFRRNNPRFAGENLAIKRDRFAPFMDIAKELGATPAQLAPAWLLHQGRDIVPIPGTRRPERINENAQASAINLDSAIWHRINELARPGLAQGATLV